MALYKLVSLEPCDCCNAQHEVAMLSDIQAYLSEHGLAAVPKEPTEAMIEVLENGWRSMAGNNMFSNYKAMIAAQGEGR